MELLIRLHSCKRTAKGQVENIFQFSSNNLAHVKLLKICWLGSHVTHLRSISRAYVS